MKRTSGTHAQAHTKERGGGGRGREKGYSLPEEETEEKEEEGEEEDKEDQARRKDAPYQPSELRPTLLKGTGRGGGKEKCLSPAQAEGRRRS